ncbi:MAG: outer membrane lipoprotein carrier protein LolA [Deltaproteobacteria bacterium]
MMNRRTLVLSAAGLALIAGLPANAAALSLDELSKYLNSIKTMEAKFTQVNDDGSILTGTLYMKRPGRMRFEYDPPEKSLVLAGSGQVAIFDGRSNQGPEQYPLKRTPLNLILEQNVDLSRRKMVVGHTSDGVTTTIVAQDPEHPDYGSIELVFSSTPVELRQWVVTDGGGNRTTVILGEMIKGGEFSTFLFNISHEKDKRGL